MSEKNTGKFLTGEDLSSLINEQTAFNNNVYTARDFVARLHDFCLDGNYQARVGVVFGLRSTGKTVGMLQTAKLLSDEGHKAAYVCYNYEETGIKEANAEIIRLAQEGCSHLFIDEATFLGGFLNAVAEWADIFVPLYRLKIIISGTDSLMLATAQSTSLFHRFVQFSTNWCSFPEYNRITGKSYVDYRRSGGLFTRETMPLFIRTAIVENLLHTIEHCVEEANRRTIYTDRLYGIDAEVIYKAVISILKCTAEDAILRHFVTNANTKNISDLGPAIANLSKQEKRDIKERVAEAIEPYREFAQIYHPKETIEALIEFLIQIGCLSEFHEGTNEFGKNNAYTFTHNALMNYSVEETVNAILHTKNVDQKLLTDSVRQAAIGAMNETIVFSHLAHSIATGNSIFEGEKLFKYRDEKDREIDAVIIERDAKKLFLFEVKSKSNINDSYAFSDEARHLFDTEVLKSIGVDETYTITRVVSYSGQSRVLTFEGDNLFLVNIEQLLERTADFRTLDFSPFP
ncbi:MAG: AAA family ATPase [Gracilibacteraceae bacterium]|nr:AAA family ATPase [Gracilibacteraceae bacterium]